jgi:hypothetical protein
LDPNYKAFGGGKVPPSIYTPYIDRYLEQNPAAILYVATDTSPWLQELVTKYGREKVSGLQVQ